MLLQALPAMLVNQVHLAGINPSAAASVLSSGCSNIITVSPAVPDESSKHSSAQAANLIVDLPPAPSPPANNAVLLTAEHVKATAEHVKATAESCENGDEDGEPAEAAFSAVGAMSLVLTDARPSSVAATAAAFLQAGNASPMKVGVMTNPLYQTSLPSAARVSTTACPDSSTSTADNNKTSSGDCSTAAIDITATSSYAAADISAPSTVTSSHLSDSASEPASIPKPDQPVAESEGTISAHYKQQQRQPVRMRPSKDNLFVARREGFAEVKENGRRTEEEKVRGVQRSPDSILFKWGQHSSQLVRFAKQPFLGTKLFLFCKVFLPALQ